MAIPSVVQAQVERANALEKEMFKVEGDETQNLQEGENTPPEGTPPVEEITTPDDGQQVAGEPDAVDNEKEKLFEHKFSVLKGKYDSEIKRYAERIASLETLLAKLAESKAVQTEKEPVKSESEQLDPAVEELVKEFPDVYAGVTKILEQKDKANKDVIEKLNKVEAMMEATSLHTLLNSLHQEVPDCEQINSDPTFVDWLQENIPYTNVSKYVALNKAYEARDTDTVIRIFKDFKEYEKAIATGSTPTPPPVKSKEKFVAPPRASRSGQSGTTLEKKTYRTEEVNKFYRDLAQRKLPFTKEQIAAKELEYFQAAKEGRIV